MRMRMYPNKYERELIKKWAAEQKVKPWQIMNEISQFANEEVFKRYFEKAYKEEKQHV